MTNTHSEAFRLPPRAQHRRLHQVIREELTPVQREVLMAYYFEDLNIPQIAKRRRVSKSTVCRTLHRAEEKIRRFLRYM